MNNKIQKKYPGIFNNELPEIYKYFINVLDDRLSEQGKIILLTYWLSYYVSQFRNKIQYNGMEIPTNCVCFLFSPSGSGKDLNYNILKRLFEPSLQQIKNVISTNTQEDASVLIEVGFSTSEGLHKAINDIDKEDNNIGSIGIYSGEFIAEFKSNPNSPTMLRDVMEISVNGDKPIKKIKNDKSQLKEIKNVILNALFSSDFSYIKYNHTMRDQIASLFSGGFSRRSLVSINTKIQTNEQDIDSILNTAEEFYEEMEHKHQRAKNLIIKRLLEITEKNLIDFNNKIITFDKQALKLIKVYSVYCDKRKTDLLTSSDLKENTCSLYGLHIGDSPFRAIKLAGVLSVIKQQEIVSLETLIESINIINLLENEMKKFEGELNKTTSEVFVETVNQSKELKNEYTAFDLNKTGFIPNKWLKSDLARLVDEANQQDPNSFYEATDKTIIRAKLNYEFKHHICVKELEDGLKKEDMAKLCGKGYKYVELNTFSDIAKYLTTTCSYCNFEYKNGIRGNEYVVPQTSFVIFDIDNSDYDHKKIHSILKKENINHIIALTSNPEHTNKFRLIVELDNIVHIDRSIYKKVLLEINKQYLLELFSIDSLPMSQMFFGYKDREVLVYDKGNKINVKNIMLEIQRNEYKPLTKKEMKTQLESTTFLDRYCYMDEGNRNNTLIRMINRCYYLEASHNQVKDFIIEANNTYSPPLTDKQLEQNIFPHLNKRIPL